MLAKKSDNEQKKQSNQICSKINNLICYKLLGEEKELKNQRSVESDSCLPDINCSVQIPDHQERSQKTVCIASFFLLNDFL